MRRAIGVLIALALMLALIPVGSAVASTTADVAATATPEYIAIAVLPTTWGPSVPAAPGYDRTDVDHFTITNGSTVKTHQYIGTTSATWASAGQTWTHSNTGESGAHTVGVWAVNGTGTWWAPPEVPGDGDEIIVKYEAVATDLNKIKDGLNAATNYDFGLAIIGPTAITDGVTKTNTIRITAVKNPTSRASSLAGGASLTIDGHGWSSFGG